MTKKTWIVWAVFLLLPGAVGLGIHFALKDGLYKRIDQAAQRSAENPAAKEYLQMYEQWLKFPAEEKANHPWGHGEYGGIAIQKRLQESRSDRLTADLPMLERGYLHYPDELADVLYGSGWRQNIEDYRHERSVAEMILIGSTFLMAVGGLIFVGGILRLLVVFITKKRCDDDDEDQAYSEHSKATPVVRTVSSDDLQGNDVSGADSLGSETDQEDGSAKKNTKGYFQSSKKSVHPRTASSADADTAGRIPMKPVVSKPNMTSKASKDSYFGWAIDSDDSASFETLMTTEPLTKELSELTEEVSAIRQYAAQQQDQMRKLQDGYDWMIIRRFCLRIIRCIDNIDDRITILNGDGPDSPVHLEDIRDELIFALESSGVEQYKPDLNISFKGLEKYAEAVRERVMTEESNHAGCIAEVVRPGYQYLVNDEDIKIVRCAQVKLYETN